MIPEQNTPWPAAPDTLAMEPGWVHVFRLPLDLPAGRIAALRALLSHQEVTRADRYHRQRDGARFTAARGQLREILGGYTQLNPKAVVLLVDAHGKPALALPQAGDSSAGAPAFNVSHSAGLALLAVGCPRDLIGIDVEAIRASLEFESMARRFFAPGEVAALLALPSEQRTAAFFACWTRKEAYIKARGLGLAIPLDGFEVSLVPGDAPRLIRPTADDPHGAEWTMMKLDPGPDYAAALCVRGPVEGIRCWDWSA